MKKTLSLVLFYSIRLIAFAQCPDNNHPHMIDLGLPSGTKWACCNVGASSPEGYGRYYAWGETFESGKHSWATYTLCKGTYETSFNLGDIAGTEYDVARTQWGVPWMMPTNDQYTELVNNCSFQWVVRNGIKGAQFRGRNGRTIFFPAAGHHCDGVLAGTGLYGDYRTSSQSAARYYDAYYICFYNGKIIWFPSRNIIDNNRSHGRSVRPVAIVNNNSYAQSPRQQTVEKHTVVKKPSSDVDMYLPSNPVNNENTFAIIIANENYQEEVKVDYALNDGEMFKQYCNKVLGIPETNIHFRKDATLNNIQKEIEWISKVAAAYEGDSQIIFYYAGHGIPDEKSGKSYLLPVDGSSTSLSTGYSLDRLYNELGRMPAQRVIIFMDACFSGSKRGDGMLASARGVAINAKPEAPQGKMLIFSAAQGDETAYPFKEKEHGLFTYYLLKKLKETRGYVSFSELGDYITSQVRRTSIVVNGKSQTPSVSASSTMGNSWKSMKLK